MKPIVQKITDMQTAMFHTLIDAIAHIKHIIPDGKPPVTRTRHTRSWIPILGSALRTIAGTATTSDLDDIKRMFNGLRSSQADAYTQWSHTEGEITSLTHTYHAGMSALEDLVREQRQTSIHTYRRLTNQINELNSLSAVIPEVIDRVSQFSVALVQTSSLSTALHDAVNGRLSTFLVGRITMSRAMRDIASHLRSINPRLHLSYQHTAEAYQATDFILSRVDRIVYITVKFPVTPLHHAFTLYDVRLFNVALPDDSRHVTRLNTDYVAFAYAPELIHYMEFQSPPPVVRNMLHLSHVPETFKRNAAPSCIFALFRNDMDLIRSLCTFTFLHNALQTSVISLDESTLLFTNISNITRRCHNQPLAHLPGCAQCIHVLPCGCSFNTSTTYIPPPLSNCRHIVSNNSPAVYTHVANLAVLTRFFSEENLGRLTASTLLRSPITADLPDFLRYTANATQALAALDTTKFALDKVANLSKAEQIAYSSKAEYLSHLNHLASQYTDDTPWYSVSRLTTSPGVIFSSALSVITFIFCVILALKQRAFLLPTIATPAAAFPLHFDYFDKSSTTSFTPYDVITQSHAVSITDYLIFFIALCFLLILMLFCSHTYYGRLVARIDTTPTVRLYLQLLTEDMQILLPFLKLPQDASYYTFTADTNVLSLKVIGHFRPKLQIDWPGLCIKHMAFGHLLKIPQTISLTWEKAGLLRRMLTGGHINPIIYAYTLHCRKLRRVYVISANTETTQQFRARIHPHMPTAPAVPTSRHTDPPLEEIEMQDLTPPRPTRIYPVV